MTGFSFADDHEAEVFYNKVNGRDKLRPCEYLFEPDPFSLFFCVRSFRIHKAQVGSFFFVIFPESLNAPIFFSFFFFVQSGSCMACSQFLSRLPLLRQNDSAVRPVPSSGALAKSGKAAVGGQGRNKIPLYKGKLDKTRIGMPSDFRHVGHIGWDPDVGFDVREDSCSSLSLFQKFSKVPFF